nr:hypothetical protein [Tanacetum cinerariifolium]
VEVAAATQANQHHFHRAYTQVATAALGRAIHHDHVTAARLAEEHGLTRPLNTRFHPQVSNARKKAASLAQGHDVAEWTGNVDKRQKCRKFPKKWRNAAAELHGRHDPSEQSEAGRQTSSSRATKALRRQEQHHLRGRTVRIAVPDHQRPARPVQTARCHDAPRRHADQDHASGNRSYRGLFTRDGGPCSQVSGRTETGARAWQNDGGLRHSLKARP